MNLGLINPVYVWKKINSKPSTKFIILIIGNVFFFAKSFVRNIEIADDFASEAMTKLWINFRLQMMWLIFRHFANCGEKSIAELSASGKNEVRCSLINISSYSEGN